MMCSVITNSVYCSFSFRFPLSVCVCAHVRTGFSDAITLNDLKNHVVLTMTESSTQITDMTLLENNSNKYLTKLNNTLTVYTACWEIGTDWNDFRIIVTAAVVQPGSSSASKGDADQRNLMILDLFHPKAFCWHRKVSCSTAYAY